MSLRHILATATLVALIGALAVPAQAGTTPPSARERLDRWAPAEHPRAFRAHLRALATDAADPIEEAERAVSGAMLAFRNGPDEASSHEPPAEGSGTLRSGGDLDADGLGDALEESYGSVSGVRGTDGKTLWIHLFNALPLTSSQGVAKPAGDLDDTPGDDILTFSAGTERVPGAYLNTTTFAALRGSDGSVLWRRTSANPWTILRAGPTRGGARINLTIPLDSGDVNGDGARDILVGRYNIVSAYDGLLIGTGQTTTQLQVLSGRDGLPVPGSAHVFAGIPDARLVPDLTGDKRADLVVVSESGGSTTIAAYPGSGGLAKWRTKVDGMYGMPAARGLELTGDELADILVSCESYCWTEEDNLRALSGADGRQVWATTTGYDLVARPAGDANDDSITDLLLVRPNYWGYFVVLFIASSESEAASHPEEEPPPSPTMSLLNGSTGTVLWSRLPGEDGYPNEELAGDANGDGVLDALISEYSYDPATDAYFETTSLISGRDGTTSWSRSDVDLYRLEPMTVDLDGDGGDDLVQISFDEFGSTMSVLSGANGAEVWGPAPARGDVYELDAAATRARGVYDLLASGSEWTYDPVTHDFEYLGEFTEAIAGDTGARIWRRQTPPEFPFD